MISIPDKVKVGFQKRNNALTNMLGFVVEQDKKGWKQSVAWERWRDHEIAPLIMDNVPKSGYIINKSLTHKPFSSFGNPRTKVRVHSPDGFEIEISTENLVEILEVSNISKKFIDSECVLGWFGREIWLIPTETEIYRNYLKKKKEQEEKELLKKTPVKKVKAQEDIEISEKRKLNKESLQIGDFVSLKETTLRPADNHFIYVGRRQIVTEKFIKRLSVNSISKNVLVENIPEVPVFVNIANLTLKQIMDCDFKEVNNSSYYYDNYDNSCLVFDDKKIAYETLNKRFSSQQQQEFKVKVEKLFENNAHQIFVLKKYDNWHYNSDLENRLKNIFNKIKISLTKEDVANEKATLPVLVKEKENNLNYDLKLLEIEPIKIAQIKNRYGSELSLEVIVRLLNPDTLDEIESHSVNISESVIQRSYSELSKIVTGLIKKEKLCGDKYCLEYNVYSTNKFKKSLKPADFKVNWTKV